MFLRVIVQTHKAIGKQLFHDYDFSRMDKNFPIASIENKAIKLYLDRIRKYQLQPFEFQKFGIKSCH